MSLLSPIQEPPPRTKRYYYISAFSVFLFIALGVFASNAWLPRTDGLTGQRYGWFGKKLLKGAPNSWIPFAPPSPSLTPQLGKEYLYAGSTLFVVEDANAVPPADLAVWRPSTGHWYVLTSPGDEELTYVSFQWGTSGDQTAPADFDGDGKTDFCVFRPSNTTWYTVWSSDASYHYPVYGQATDKPSPADYEGDGKSEVAAFRPSVGKFYISQTSTSTTLSYQVGQSGDKVVPQPIMTETARPTHVYGGMAAQASFAVAIAPTVRCTTPISVHQ